MRRRRLWGTIVALAAALVILSLARWELKVSGTFRLFPGERSSVRTEVDGVISVVSVEEGDVIAPGDTLVRLDDRGYLAELLEAEADAAKWRAELELLRKGPLREEIVRLEKAVERARTKVSYSQREYERVGELSRAGLVPSNEYEQAEQALTLDRKDLERAESDLRVLQAGNRPEKIRAAEAEIERLAASTQYLRQQIEKTVIVSPVRGVLATHRMRDKVGAHVEIGDEVCQIVNAEKLLLEMPVSERDVLDVRAGMQVKLRARAIPARSFSGRVVSVPPVAIDSNNRTVLLVTSEVDNDEGILKPGMTGTAKIYCGKRSIIDLWTRKIIRFVRIEFWWW